MANIEINGIQINAREGAMVIEAADEAGIYIPRFCYHKQLSIAANCRMCLVEVEKVGKPLPACATPVTDGMKIFTKSPKAIEAQEGVMEFLLINHPLDCPICDQGGECELQDIAIGFGNSVSQYRETKRVVLDRSLGPLISTDMTRCIHCTRCVRFGEEIAGIRELGATGRGEHMEIGTYITSNVTSELSGNVIDLCPVGALTSKPFRFSARSWELQQKESIAPHDCLGSNINIHIFDEKVIRVVPKENPNINETWLSDRDRFSYEGLNSGERLTQPMIKQDGEWQETDWMTALNHVVDNLKTIISDYGANSIGAVASPNSTVEELFLMQKWLRNIGVNNLDHRIRQQDFSDQDKAPAYPYLGQSINELESLDAVLLVGSNIRLDQPLAALRLRKACLKNASIMCVNPVDYNFYFPIAEKCIVSPDLIPVELAHIAKALLEITGQAAPDGFEQTVDKFTLTKTHKDIANNLVNAKQTSILLGPISINHPNFSAIRMLSNLIAKLSEANIGYLADSGNSSGAWLSGMIPHRLPANGKVEHAGLSVDQMFAQKMKSYILLDVEPYYACSNPTESFDALVEANFVVALTAFVNDSIKGCANVLLPICPFTETSGSFVNIEGVWQSFSGVVPPLGEARPAWKIFRVMGNLFDIDGFDYTNSIEVKEELLGLTNNTQVDNVMAWECPEKLLTSNTGVVRISETQVYAGDSLQRRSVALHKTKDAHIAEIRISESLADSIGIKHGEHAIAIQNEQQVCLPVVVDNDISENSVLIYAGLQESSVLNGSFSPVTIKRV